MKVNIKVISIVLFFIFFCNTSPCPAGEIKIGEAPFIEEERFEGHRISCHSFDVSPDGQKMIFIVDIINRWSELWTAHMDGSNSRKLYAIEKTDETGIYYNSIDSPKYSPDGTRAGFINFGERGTSLYVLNLATGIVSELLPEPGISEAGWKDNLHMYFTKIDRLSRARTLYQINIKGTGKKSIYSGNFEDAYPSPDWKKICLIYYHKYPKGKSYIQWYTVEMLDLQSMERTEIIGENRKFQGYHPVWSPDGNSLIFDTDSGALKIGVDGKNEGIVAPGQVWAWSKKQFILYATSEEGEKRRYKTVVYKRDIR